MYVLNKQLRDQLNAEGWSVPPGVNMELHTVPVGQLPGWRASIRVIVHEGSTPDLSFLREFDARQVDDLDPPTLSRTQVRALVDALPATIGHGLRERMNAVLSAVAPGPFSDALGELETYLSGLDDAGGLPFDQQIRLKAYVLTGWKQWRAGFAGREL